MPSTIVTKNSSTASAVPVTGDLTQGELAVNVTDKKLYTKDSGGTVVKLVGGLGNQEANAVAITGGSINGTTVGATTASTGAFTTLSASSTVSGTGFSTYLASPPAIGGTAAAAGSFTTLSASSTTTLSYGTANGVLYLNGSKVATSGSALTFNGTNLTIGSGGKLLYSGVSYGVGIDPDGSGGFGAGYNFETNGGTPRYLVTGPVSGQYISSGSSPFVAWYLGSSAASGTAAPEQMRLTSTGLGIGTSSPAAKLDVIGSSSDQLRLRSDAGAYYRIGRNSSDGLLDFYASQTGFQGYRFGGIDGTWMTLNTSGNLGLGVTPSAWGSPFSAVMQFTKGSIACQSNSVILFNNAYYDGANYRYVNTASAGFYEQTGGQHIWSSAGSGTAGNAITFTQAMTLDASGNLGVGTTSPTDTFSFSRALDVNGSTGAFVYVRNNGSSTNVGGIGYSGSDMFISNKAAGNIRFFCNTDATERARIDSSGNLLVGKTSYGGTATGIDLGKNGFVGAYSPDTTNGTTTFAAYSNGASAYRFYVGWGGTVYATSTTISAISDIRFKENIRDLDVGLDKIMALKPRLYDWKEGKGANIKNARGFIAQEFEQVFPDLIDEWKDPAPEGEEPYKSVRQDLIPVLVKAIQEQQALITQLQADVAALKGN